MASKTKSYGAVISYSAAGTSYTALSDIISITPPTLEAADLKVSHLESASYTHEYLAGWTEPGEIAITGYFTKTQFATLLGLQGGTSDGYYWKVTTALIGTETTANTLISRGHLKKVGFDEINSDDDGKITCPFAVKVTGKPVFTAAT
jgi:hypothetical protein